MKFSADNPFAQPKAANPIAKRLGLALLLAAVVHLAAIFSLDWELKQTPELSQSLDVTLVSFSSETAAGTATEDDKANAANPDDDAANANRPITDENASNANRPLTDDNAANANRPLTDDNAANANRPFTDDNAPNANRPLTDDNAANANRPLTDDDAPSADRPLTDDDAPSANRPFTDDDAPSANRPFTDDDASNVGRPFMGDNNATPKPTISNPITASTDPAATKPEPEPEVKAPPKPTPKPQPKPKPQVQKPPATSQPKAAAQPNTARKPLAFGRDQLSASLAGIQADNAFARQQPNQKSRVSRHHLATSKRDVSAWYRDAWRKKVERIGNLNYPEEARRQGLYGNLRMRVLINRDGSLQEMRVLESSGHKVLDQAALNIVRLSAPFAPFSNELAAQYEQVEIIRTWRFERGDRLSSQ